MGPFIKPFFDVLLLVLHIIEWIVFVWVILSWVLLIARQTSFRWRYRQAYGILEQLNDLFSRMTGPILRPFRRILPAYKTMGIDWSPMLLLLTIFLLRGLIVAAYGAILLR